MKAKVNTLFALSLLAFAPATFAQYTMTLTGVGDDSTTASHLNSSWTATETSSGSLNGTEKFTGSVMFKGTPYTAQQAFNATAWLATRLVLPSNVTNVAAQTHLFFALRNNFDNGSASSSSAVTALENTAFTRYHHTVQSTVSVYTPATRNRNGKNWSQEFLVVNPNAAPEIDPTSAASALTLLLGGLVVFRGRKVRI